MFKEKAYAKQYINKKMKRNKKYESCNTTPLLTVKAPTSLGTTRKVTIGGGATFDTRIESGEDGGNISGGGNQRRRNRSGGAYHGGSRIQNCDDDGGVVVERVGDLDDGSWLIGSNGGGGRSQGGRCLNLLSSNISDNGSGRGNLWPTMCLN